MKMRTRLAVAGANVFVNWLIVHFVLTLLGVIGTVIVAILGYRQLGRRVRERHLCVFHH